MQNILRHDVLRALFHARPITQEHMHDPIETELTRAARASVDNADKIIEDAETFEEDDFKVIKKSTAAVSKKQNQIKKKRKAQRQNKKKNRKK